MMRNRVPRLSKHYVMLVQHFYAQGNHHRVWFYLMAAWFYEDEDEELAGLKRK